MRPGVLFLTVATTTALLVASALPALAQDPLPRQMLYLPIPLCPDPQSGRTEASLGFHEFELPDGRRAQIARVNWWIPLGTHQFARVGVDYAGLESEDLFRYGGGRMEIQWTTQYESAWPAPFGLDLALTVPVGDATLHPLSAKAPALRGRLRSRLVTMGPVHVWVGLWSRVVSPPSNDVREAPRGAFPSGAGLDAVVRVQGGGWGFESAVRRPYVGGVPLETTLHATITRHFSDALAVRVGAATSIEIDVQRLMDHMASVALVWTPRIDRDRQGGRDDDERGRRP